MRLLTYQMPDDILSVAVQGEFDEFDLNAFFEATGEGDSACFVHESDVQKWLDLIRGEHAPTQLDSLKAGSRPPFPYADARLLPYMQHSFWYLPTVASCFAMANLLKQRHNTYWHSYEVVVAAGAKAGIGVAALPPVRAAIEGWARRQDDYALVRQTHHRGHRQAVVRDPHAAQPHQPRDATSQAAFRVQSPWAITNPNGDNPNEEEILKPVAFVFDFAPTRALRQMADYASGSEPHG